MNPSEKVLIEARASSRLCELLEQFFVDQTRGVYDALRTCEADKLIHHQAYLQALDNLESHLLGYINTYEIMEARRLHVRE